MVCNQWIILLNYNMHERCLAHLETLSGIEKVGLIFVDNQSRDDDYHALRDVCKQRGALVIEAHDEKRGLFSLQEQLVNQKCQLVLFRTHKNLGYGGGNNVALRVLHGLCGSAGQFLVVNPDVILSRQAAQSLLDCHAAICGPEVYERYKQGISTFGHTVDFSTGFSEGGCASDSNIKALSGCCLKLSGCALEKYGYLPEDIFLYGEEIIYFERVYRQGDTPHYLRGVVVEHIGSLSVTKHTFMHYYYLFRNSLTYFIEIAGPHYGRYGRFIWLYTTDCLDTLRINFRKRNWAGIRGILFGVWHGLLLRKGPLGD